MWETNRRMPLVLLALLAFAALASGCRDDPDAIPPGNSPSEAEDEIVAMVGEAAITRGQLLERLMASYGARTLRSMMLHSAVEAEAASRGIEVSAGELERELASMRQGYESEDEFYRLMDEQLGMSREDVRMDAEYRLLLEKLSIQEVSVSESEIDLYLEEHGDEYLPRVQFELARIVVRTEEQASSLLGLLANGEDFAALAFEFSLDEYSADAGGALGWVEDGDPFEAPAVLEAAASMRVGDTVGPIPIEDGFAIIRLDGRKEELTMPEEAIRESARRQIALGKAGPLRDFEQTLLEKYGADIKEASLGPAFSSS